MNRRLLFPAVVATAWAQQTSPATAEPERALRARAEQFYALEVDKKFRQAEDLVAADSKDFYYDNGKPDIKNFRIDKIEFSADGKIAKLTLTLTAILRAPGFPVQDFATISTQTWKLEDGDWVWYFDTHADVDTPFGKWHMSSGDGTIALPPGMPANGPNIENIDKMVSIDRTHVELVAGSPKVETVTITNSLPGVINIEIGKDRPAGLIVSIDKDRLARNEKAVVSFSLSGDARPLGTVRISMLPIQEFLVQIRTK